MPLKKASTIRKAERAKKISKAGKVTGRPKIQSPFKMSRYPTTDLEICLDIDGTLLDCDTGMENGEIVVKDLIVRPWAKEFIDFCCKIASKVFYFTAAEELPAREKLKAAGLQELPLFSYKDLLKKAISVFDDNWVRIDRNYHDEVTIKGIPNFDSSKTVIVDDNCRFYVEDQRRNVIHVNGLHSESPRDTLPIIADFLIKIGKEKKRNIAKGIDDLATAHPADFRGKRYPRNWLKVHTTRRGLVVNSSFNIK